MAEVEVEEEAEEDMEVEGDMVVEEVVDEAVAVDEEVSRRESGKLSADHMPESFVPFLNTFYSTILSGNFSGDVLSKRLVHSSIPNTARKKKHSFLTPSNSAESF